MDHISKAPCKLAIRDRGEWIVAYVATMDESEMIEISRLLRSVAERTETFRAWLKAMQDDLFRELAAAGMKPDAMVEIPRPKHERN